MLERIKGLNKKTAIPIVIGLIVAYWGLSISLR